MTAIHQKSPWSRDKYGCVVDANGDSVLFRGVSTLSAGSDERMAMAEANTDLAASAPDLLEALEMYAAVYNEHWKPGMPILEPISDAAIAKARGIS